MSVKVAMHKSVQNYASGDAQICSKLCASICALSGWFVLYMMGRLPKIALKQTRGQQLLTSKTYAEDDPFRLEISGCPLSCGRTSIFASDNPQ